MWGVQPVAVGSRLVMLGGVWVGWVYWARWGLLGRVRSGGFLGRVGVTVGWGLMFVNTF